jgi:inner membrane protein
MIFAHAFTGAMVGKFASGRERPWRLWSCLALLPVVPDLDFIAYRLGVPYDSPWSHRGFTHSLVFALVLALLTHLICFGRTDWRTLAKGVGLLFVAVASHGILDALTNGGRGVAFLWPFTDQRFFFSCRPIVVAPLTLHGPTLRSMVRVLESELRVVAIPLLLAYLPVALVRRRLAQVSSVP